MKLKMPITLYDVSVHPKLQNLNYYAKELNFFSPNLIYFQPSYTHRNQKYLYMHWGLYGMKKLCHAFLYTLILLT